MDPKIKDALISSAVKCVAPSEASAVEKDECMFSFDNPFSPTGLYTNLQTLKSYGREYVESDSKATGQTVYLFQKFYKHKRVPKELKKACGGSDDAEDEPASEVTKLGLGIEGGFTMDDELIEVEKTFRIAVLPDFVLIELDNDDIPMMVSQSANAVIAHAGTAAHEAVKAFDDFVKESKHSDSLLQLAPEKGHSVSRNPDDWVCPECGAKENLWFNLGDGYIGCGRRNWDGSGGCGASLRHFAETGSKYPLSVKLGTINPEGADVFSYDEDDMVLDKNLSQHLSHWGIDIMKQTKTEKSMEELQIDLNKKFSFGFITEEGKSLTKVRGAGFVGLENLGNSCYMNSMIQVLFSVDEMKSKYLTSASSILEGAPDGNASDDLVSQCAKLCVGLHTDRYVKQDDEVHKLEEDLYRSKLAEMGLTEAEAKAILAGKDPKTAKSEEEEEDGAAAADDGDADGSEDVEMKEADSAADCEEGEGVRCVSIVPRLFKRLVGQNHGEFSSNRQQDSVEYMRHFMELLSRRERVCTRIDKSIPTLKSLFTFNLEERLQCAVSEQVRYSMAEDLALPLPIDTEDVTNKDEVAEWEALKTKLEEEAMAAAEAACESDDLSAIEAARLSAKAGIDQSQKVFANIPFEQCLKRYFETSTIEGWMSPATGAKGLAYKRLRMGSCPKYLAIQVSRYYYDEKWTAQKYDVVVEAPLSLSLEEYRGKGLQESEVELPAGGAAGSGSAMDVDGGATASPEADVMIVSALTGMGFSENAGKRAALAVSNAGVEAASEWLFAHMDDADINDPPVSAAPASDGAGAGPAIDMDVVSMLSMSLGFSAEHVMVALKHTNGDGDRAADWLFSHASTLDESVSALKAEQDADAAGPPPLSDGEGSYELFAIVSHLGKATSHGHYVAHLLRDGQWYIFNDSKVAKSESPPFGHGYCYFYRRTTPDTKSD